MSGRLKRDGTPWGVRGDHWTPEEDTQLRAIVGTVPREQLAQVYAERTGVQRSLTALVIRCKRLNVSMWAQGLSMTEVETLFGIDHRVIARRWAAPGFLAHQRWTGRGPNRGWWFHQEDVERFIRAYPWLYEVSRMQRGHPLTQLAEMVKRADPWRTYQDLATFVGISTGNLDKWRRRGFVPHQRQPKAGPGDRIMVRGRDFRAIKAAIDEARAEGLRRNWERTGAPQRAHQRGNDGRWKRSDEVAT